MTVLNTELVDGEYITTNLLNPNVWTCDWEEFCKEYSIKNAYIIEKRVRDLSELNNTLNLGKKNSASDKDKRRLRKSFEDNNINTALPPICIDENDCTINGGTRLDDAVFGSLGIKAYCTWKIGFETELDKIDFANKVNDPNLGFYSRSVTEDDTVAGVLDWAAASKIITGKPVTEQQLKDKIDDYSKNSLDLKGRKSVLEKILKSSSSNVKPSRYKLWEVPSFITWAKSDGFIDSLKKRWKTVAKIVNIGGVEKDDPDADLEFYVHNARYMKFPSPRWANYLYEMHKCTKVKKPTPMNRIVITAPPEIMSKDNKSLDLKDGDEHKIRIEYTEEEKKFLSMLDDIFKWKIENGCYPSQHEDAILRFAPSTNAEVTDGRLLTLGDVMEKLAKEEIKEKQEGEN